MHFLEIFGQKKCLFGSKTVFLGQEVHYYMVYIAYFTELILQICDYAQKRRIWHENCKYALDENFHCHFCSRRKAAKFCHPGIGQNSDLIVQLQDLLILENHFISQVCESQLISTLPPLNLFVALEIYSKNNLSKFSKPTQCRYFSNWFMVGRSPQNIPLSQAFPNNCLVTCDVPFRTAAIGLDKILKAHRTNAKGRRMPFSNCIGSFLLA